MKTYLLCASLFALVACDGIPDTGTTEATGTTGPSGTGPGQGTGTGSGGGGEAPTFVGTPLDVPVPEMGRVHVDLDTPAIVAESAPWDIAFEGYDVYTNSGPSGPGNGAAFGPNALIAFLTGEIPTIPFLIEDRAGGAFLDWYDYEGDTHALYSRFHIIGIKSGGVVYKLQILGYYGEIDGAPVSAVYQLRYASVTDGAIGATVSIEALDATAGGPSPDASDPSACLVLATQEIKPLTPAQAAADTTWDLCFRRDSVTVNGGEGGPGSTTAVNFDASAVLTETVEQVKARTAASELGKFDAADWTFLNRPAFEYRGDGVVSAFTGKWRDPENPRKPAYEGWVVRASDGTTPFLLSFESFTGPTDASPGTVRLYVQKPTGGSLP